MSSQYLIESKINDNLKVLSNEYLMSTIRKNLEYKNNYIINLDVDVKLENDSSIDDNFVHILHFNLHIKGNGLKEIGTLENTNLEFTYYFKEPDKIFYDKKGGSIFLITTSYW